MTWYTTPTGHYDIECVIPFQGRDGDINDLSDLNVTVLDTIAMNFDFVRFGGTVEELLFAGKYVDGISPLNLKNMKWGLDNYTIPQILDRNPTSIKLDGKVDITNEWRNALRIKHFDSMQSMDLYFLRNSTHILIGGITSDAINNGNEYVGFFFDEGNDGSYGSGSRDCRCRNNQEDYKVLNFHDNSTWDGFYVFDGSSASVGTYGQGGFLGKSCFAGTFQFEVAIPMHGVDGTPGDPAGDYSDLNVKFGDTPGLRINYEFDGMTETVFPHHADFFDMEDVKLQMGLTLGTAGVTFPSNILSWQSARLNPQHSIWINGTATAIPGAALTSVEVMNINATTSNLTTGSFGTNLGSLTNFVFKNTTVIPDGIWMVTLKIVTMDGTVNYVPITLKVDSNPPALTQSILTSNSTRQDGGHAHQIFINGTMNDPISGIQAVGIVTGSGNFSTTFSGTQMPLTSGFFEFVNTSYVAPGSYWGLINITDIARNSHVVPFSFVYVYCLPAVISGFQMSPGSGTVATIFTITINVTQTNNIAPAWVQVSISGFPNITMTKQNPSDTDFTDEVKYSYRSLLPFGTVDFIFWVDDSVRVISLHVTPGVIISNHENCPALITTPTIDGVISPGEWDDALWLDRTTQPGTYGMIAYFKHDSNYLYVGIEAVFDNDTEYQDNCRIFFEFDGNGVLGRGGGLYDKCIYFWAGSVWMFNWRGYWNHEAYNPAWIQPNALSTSPSVISATPHRQYEFRITLAHTDLQLTSSSTIMVGIWHNDEISNPVFISQSIPFGTTDTSTTYWLNITMVSQTSAPISNHPPDTLVLQNSTSQSITWRLNTMASAGKYRVLRNSTVIQNWQAWPGINADINIPVNTDIGRGYWLYRIEYNDSTGRFGIPDVVNATVNDIPTISSRYLPGSSFAKNQTGIAIDYTLLDKFKGKGTYRVLINGSAYIGWTSWTSGVQFSVPVDSNRGVALFNYTMQYKDSFGTTGAEDRVYLRITKGIPDPFLLSSNATSPDFDGTFALNWSVAAQADNYSVYRYSSWITKINGSVTLLSNGMTSREYLIVGAANGTYYFLVIALNMEGNRSSNCLSITVEHQKPSPFVLSSDCGGLDTDGAFNLTWTQSTGAVNYTVYSHSSYISSINGTVTPRASGIKGFQYPIAVFANGTYYFIVVAFNQNGNRSSNCYKVVVELRPPSSFVASSDAEMPDWDGAFTVTWTASTYAKNYSVYSYSHYITIVNASLTPERWGITGLSCPIKKSTNGTYYFIVVAFNEFGNITSNCVSVEILLLPPGGFVVTSNADSPDTDGNYNLNWNAASRARNYTIYSFNHPITQINASLSLIARSLVVLSRSFGNVPNGTYYYVIVACNENGNTSSNVICVNVARPLPGHFTLTTTADQPDFDAFFALNWTVSIGVTTYSAYASMLGYITEINSSVVLITGGLTQQSLVLGGLPNGIYYFAIASTNQNGYTLSNSVKVEISLMSPTSLSVTSDAGDPDSDGSFMLSWTLSSYATYYVVYSSSFPITMINSSLKIVAYHVTNTSIEIKGMKTGTLYFIVLACNFHANTTSNCLRVNVDLTGTPSPNPIIKFLIDNWILLAGVAVGIVVISAIATTRKKKIHNVKAKVPEKKTPTKTLGEYQAMPPKQQSAHEPASILAPGFSITPTVSTVQIPRVEKFYCEACGKYYDIQNPAMDTWYACPACHAALQFIKMCPQCNQPMAMTKEQYDFYKDKPVQCWNCKNTMNLL